MLPIAGVLALVVSSWAVAVNGAGPSTAGATTAHAGAFAAASMPQADVSRSLEVRPPIPEAAERDVVGSKYAKTTLDVHAGPTGSSPTLAEIDPGKAVEVTGKTAGRWAEVVHKGAVRWVAAASLAAEKPLGGAPCASGSSMEVGLQPDTIRVHRAVCAQFPQIVRYLGRGGGGEHARGRAVDIMVSDLRTGNDIAAFAQRYARELGVSQVIWQQRIWTAQRAGNGWRGMKDRGSATANHRDHVHVTTYGDAGTG